MSSTDAVIGFVDRKQDGYFPVYGIDGGELAQIRVPWGCRKFTAVTPTGQPVCTGRPVTFSRTYEVSDPYGGLLLSLRSNFWSGRKRVVTLADGSELLLQGAGWPSRDWSVTGADGATVLSIVATASGWSFHPDAYAVKVADPRLTLAHVIGIVEANRILVKSARAAAAASAG